MLGMFDLESLMYGLLIYASALPETGSDHGLCLFSLSDFQFFLICQLHLNLNKLVGR